MSDILPQQHEHDIDVQPAMSGSARGQPPVQFVRCAAHAWWRRLSLSLSLSLKLGLKRKLKLELELELKLSWKCQPQTQP